MARYTTKFPCTIEFDGDSLECQLRRMKRKHVALASPYMQRAHNGDITMSFDDQLKFLEVAAEVLEDCLVGISGLVIDDEPFDKEKHLEIVLDDSYFLSLITDLFSNLMQQSFLSGDDQKKLLKNQDDTSNESQVAQREVSAV